MFPSSGSMTRHPLPSPGSGWITVPLLPRYYEVLRRPTAPRAALRCLRLALPTRAPVFVSPASPTPAWGLEFSGLATPQTDSFEMETAGTPRFLENPSVPMPCSLTPEGPNSSGHKRSRHGPRTQHGEGSYKTVISGLNGTASALAVYASFARLLASKRKTRFWLLAKLYQTGLVTRRVPTKGFQDVSYISSSFPKLRLAQAASPFPPPELAFQL